MGDIGDMTASASSGAAKHLTGITRVAGATSGTTKPVKLNRHKTRSRSHTFTHIHTRAKKKEVKSGQGHVWSRRPTR